MSAPRPGPADVLLPGFVGTTLPGWLAERLAQGLAGVCLFAENITSPGQLAELTAQIRAANPSALVAVDEEGGDVTRLHAATGSPYPGNALLGRLDSPDTTRGVAVAVARELRAAGINLVLGPVADVNSDPRNPVIGVRSFGTRAEHVSTHTAAWVRGAQAAGVFACAKHFPGHGDTHTDSHVALPVVDRGLDVLRERELVPFAGAIAAGVRTIMTSHILLPRLDADDPATFSTVVLDDVLRGELGFDGVIVSDALDMVGASGDIGIPAAAVRALAAGCDLLCIGSHNTDEQLTAIIAALEAATNSGELRPGRLADAGARVLLLRETIPAGETTPGGEVDDIATVPDAAAIVGGFAITSTAARRLSGCAGNLVVLELQTEASIAVGPTPWGLGAAGVAVHPIGENTGGITDLPHLPDGATFLVVGRDNHRHRWIREFVDTLRTSHPSTVVVDMGWPGADRAYADVATFGGSRSVGRALAAHVGLAPNGSGRQEGVL